jgi:hypothetical protein
MTLCCFALILSIIKLKHLIGVSNHLVGIKFTMFGIGVISKVDVGLHQVVRSKGDALPWVEAQAVF